MSINPPRLQRPRLPLMRELSPQATEGEKSFDFIRIYIQHRIFTISLPQSASLTAPSSEGAVCTVSLFRQTVRGQRSPKAKQTEGVGVQRYVRPSVCAGSQNALRSKLFVKENVKFPFQKRSAKNRKPQIASLRFDGLGLF